MARPLFYATDFIKLFGNNPKYHLTIKAHNESTLRIYDKYGRFVSPTDAYSNISIITEEYDIDNLVSLYHRHHCLVYPTWGEGFGFIPVQALASGMPVITTYPWAEYKEFIGPLKLKSTLTDETLPKAVGDSHLGQMFKPDEIDLASKMLDATENFRAYSGYLISSAFAGNYFGITSSLLI